MQTTIEQWRPAFKNFKYEYYGALPRFRFCLFIFSLYFVDTFIFLLFYSFFLIKSQFFTLRRLVRPFELGSEKSCTLHNNEVEGRKISFYTLMDSLTRGAKNHLWRFYNEGVGLVQLKLFAGTWGLLEVQRISEVVFLNVYGAQESFSRNRFFQHM